MKVNFVNVMGCLGVLLWSTAGTAAIKVTNKSDAAERTFIFIENNSDDNYFITPQKQRDPRITGSNRWTIIKAGPSGGGGTQQSLGYVDNGDNTPVSNNYMLDMWIDDLSISNPLVGFRCINFYKGCNLATSLIEPQLVDSKGFYGAMKPSGSAAMWMHGMMGESFYTYLQQQPVGATIKFTLNGCYTSQQYDATKGERCKDQSSGYWYKRLMTHIKGAHIRLINSQALAEVFINSDGIPTLGEGNIDCKVQVANKMNGISCKMLNYTVQTNGMSNTSLRIFPAVMDATLAAALRTNEMQFSLDGQNWTSVNGQSNDINFDKLKEATSVYIFFSSQMFKKMVNMGITDINTKDLFSFRLRNSEVPESGWYEFSTSNRLIIKPRDFGVSIISDELISNPHKEGDVKKFAPSLDFGYIITTSGKTKADEVKVMVKGPTTVLNGKNYCMFSSSDGTTRVPFPAKLTFTTQSGINQPYDIGCDENQWYDITNALWASTPWHDISGDVGTMEKTKVLFSILMDDPISLRTVEDEGWYGEVSASGEIHVEATWKNVN